MQRKSYLGHSLSSSSQWTYRSPKESARQEWLCRKANCRKVWYNAAHDFERSGRGQLNGSGLRRRSIMANAELLRKLDAAIAEKSLLKHPFYQDWQAGEL